MAWIDWVCLGSCFLLALGQAAAAEVAPSASDQLARAQSVFGGEIQPLIQKYCGDCHLDGMTKGDFSLDPFTNVTAIVQGRKAWERVLANVQSGEMPPKKKAQPTLDERKKISDWIEQTLFAVDPSRPDPGRVTLRRLNRTEYNNTIRDLVGVDFKPAEDFPQDDIGYGFDNIGDVLSIPPLLLEKYFQAASRIMNRALVTGPAAPTRKVFKTAEIQGGDARPDGRKHDYEGESTVEFEATKSGEYTIRIAAGSQPGFDEAVRMELRRGGETLRTFDVVAPREAQEFYEHKARLEAGKTRLTLAMLKAVQPIPEKNGKKVDRRLLISRVEVIGPHTSVWPPLAESHTRILFKTPEPGARVEYKKSVARDVLERFATRAFRRPVTESELERLVGLAVRAFENGENFETGVQVACTAVLVSPHFLFRGELQPEPDNPKSVHPVNEYALASRLSYFLWSTMPDDELFTLAGRGELRKNLGSQVDRMLRHPKSRALVENFAGQWLQLRLLDIMAPDREKFPAFQDSLRAAMRRESELFVDSVFRENRSLLELIDADYTFVNGPLAKLYGIQGVEGSEFVRVSLKGTPRGGLLTHGSILTLTSNPTRTSPVKRGKYVLDNLLGTPPPPPPPNVPLLEEEQQGQKLTGTLRQRLEKHRADALCASCHDRMDPIGFGFENFDAIGAWRDRDGDQAIDTAGELLTGEKFSGVTELKRILAESRRGEFVRCLSEKLLTYALGRGLEYYDRPAVQGIVARVEKENFKASALVHAVVQSVPFQKRRGDGDASAFLAP